MITLLNALFPRPNCARNGIQSTTTFKFPLQGVLRLKEVLDKKASFLSSFRPARARRVCTVSIAVQDFFRLAGPFQRKYCSMRFDGKSACCPLILYFPHSRCWRHVNMNGLLWCDLCFPRSVSFCLLCNECFCFALCMSLFYIFLIFCMFLFGFLYFTQFPFWFFWLFIFDIYWCLIDTLFSSVLFITHPYFLVCFFAFSYSLSLSLPHCFFVAFTQDWKVPKINRSVQKMEEPLNILTIGPEQMNKCSGENTLLALKN